MAQESKKITILVVDDQEVVRCGLKSLLAGSDIQIAAEATTGQAAVKYAIAHEVDVVLMDVRMPDGDGLTALGRIKLDKPELPIVLLSAFDNPTFIARAVAMGATGFLLKTCTRDELIAAITKAATGENLWTREELRRVSGSLRTPRLGGDVEVSLSQREGEVLKQLAYGLTNKQIADVLHISYETVKEHIQHILRKIGARHRTEAAVWAVHKGLV